MSSPTSTWSDRRGLFQKGKEVHQPGKPATSTGAGVVDAVRRASVSSTDGLEKTTSNTSVGSGSPTEGRRRSSTAGSGLFANLTQHKRGSEDYGERRMSHSDQNATSGGFLGGWYQSTFKGVQKPGSDAAQKKRGVME